jgi:hypothetical protein
LFGICITNWLFHLNTEEFPEIFDGLEKSKKSIFCHSGESRARSEALALSSYLSASGLRLSPE